MQLKGQFRAIQRQFILCTRGLRGELSLLLQTFLLFFFGGSENHVVE